jgi:uncharacterized protein (TIGR02145 family)
MLTNLKVNVNSYLFFYCYFQKYLYFCSRTVYLKRNQKVKIMKTTIHQVIVLFIVFFVGRFADGFSQNICKIELHADIHHCTCLNDGEIKFNLTKSSACQLDTLNIRYSLYSPLNSISVENSISPIFRDLPPGDYTGVVSALHHTEEHGIDANIIVYDTLYISLGTSYSEPNVGILNHEFTLENRYGIVRSLPCMPTGIVQLKITGGKMPYTVIVLKFDGTNYTPYKTETIEHQQHDGNDPTQMNFHDYYNVDSLSAGKYRLTFSDACGYTLPDYEVQIQNVPDIGSTGGLTDYANNDNGNNRNKIYVNHLTTSTANSHFAKNAAYYMLQQQDSGKVFWQYRWIDPAINGHEADTSEWKAVVFGRTEHSINAAEKYCDLWDQKLRLQVLDVNCHGQIEYTVTLQKPLSTFHYFTKTNSYPELSYSYTDSCGKHLYSVQKTYYDYDYYPYKDYNKLFTSQMDGNRKVRYIITDVAEDTIISQGITGTYSGDLSYRHIFEFDSIYHDKTVKFKVLDALGCTIADKDFTVSSRPIITITNPSFYIYGENETANFCGHSKFTQYYTFTTGLSDLDTFQITDSPGQMSNISMVYKEDIHQWKRLDSNDNITIGNYHGDLAIENMLSRGKFTFRYVSKCYTTVRNQQLDNSNYGIGKYYVPQAPTYLFEPTCTGLRIKPTSGSYTQHGFNLYTNEPTVYNARAVFRVFGNPSLPNKVTGYYQLGDVIDISLEGDIRIEMCDEYNYTNPEHLCHFRDTVIHVSKQTLQYDYFYSYCCQISDTVSTVRTRAKGGMPPYLYTIHDKSGKLLDSNYIGDFYKLPLPHHDTVYLKVTDQCGTNFIYKGQVIEQRLIKKAWFDDGSAHKTIPDSNWCQLFAITLDKINYHWDGPNGFTSDIQNPQFFIPVDSNMSGKYYLSLQDSACGLIQDSLMLKVLTKSYIPELLWIEDSICSGQNYEKYGFSITSSPSEERRIYYDTLVSLMDDSTFLKLTILPVYRSSHIDSIITAHDSYTYGGIIFSDTGLYEIKLKTSCNCDSILFIHLMFSKYLPCPDAVDYNGYHYSAIRINQYCWTTENLKSTNYSDGRPIEKYYEYYADVFPDITENVNIFGRLYDWYAAIDTGVLLSPDTNGNVQGICPDGWLLPTTKDFAELHSFTVKQLRSPLYWLHNPGTNESGFTSLPAGYYDAQKLRYSNLLGETYYWTSAMPYLQAKFMILFVDCLQECHNTSTCNAYSVRCIKKN